MIDHQIAKAILAVKKQVKQLGVDERNEHGRYNYVSVDKFYDVIGKLMAEAGLALLIDETATEVKEGKSGNPWLFAQYDLSFMHETGAVSEPLRRSLALPINGPQTYGAAQSYIEKQFLRQIFKVPTGEKDADNTAQNDTPSAGANTQQQPRRGRPPKLFTPPDTTKSFAPDQQGGEQTQHVHGPGDQTGTVYGPETAAQVRIRALIDRFAHHIKTAPSVQALNLCFEDGRDELAEIEAAGENGKAAVETLRGRFMERIKVLEGG